MEKNGNTQKLSLWLFLLFRKKNPYNIKPKYECLHESYNKNDKSFTIWIEIVAENQNNKISTQSKIIRGQFKLYKQPYSQTLIHAFVLDIYANKDHVRSECLLDYIT
jgi:hypothetical protein